jgi:3',5'-cyclic AMP phosphodiesterase CpdA
MIEKTRIILPVLLAMIFLSSTPCSTARRSEFKITAKSDPGDFLVIWALSDIQPKDASQRWHLERAIDDVNARAPYAKIAVVAGDIVHHRKSEHDFRWYLEARKKSKVPHWYEIAGNHDMKDEMNYRKYIGNNLHYSVEVGNAIILLMSDEDRFPAQKISDETFRWWKKKVEQNQDRIIITVTHAYLEQSRLFGYMIDSRNIGGSARFADVLKRNRVDLWICGHTHLPSFMNDKWRVAPELGGTFFVNVSAIRKSFINNIESNFIILKKGRDNVLVRTRNHEKGRYLSSRDIFLKLGKKFQWDGSPPVVKYE